MGTNYYLHESGACPTCGHKPEPLHIGKSSSGWCFSLHVDPDIGIRDLPDWEDRWAKPGARIVNEYGGEITVDEMRATILARVWNDKTRMPEIVLRQNHAFYDPADASGLLRHKVDGRHCIGNGSGTYDLITGEFS